MTTNIAAREAVVRDLETIHCELKRGLESAIRSGSSTEKLRGKLSENAEKLDAARAELHAAQDAERQQGANALHAAATSLADEAVGRIAGAAEALIFPAVFAPDFTSAPAIAAAAANVVAARSTLAEAEADHESAQRDVDDLARKLAAKRARHADLSQERVSTGSEGGAAEMYALSQDAETLAAMHKQAQAKANALLAPVNVARVALNTAQAQATRVEARLLAEHLAEHARQLDLAYTSCLRAIQEAGARAGGAGAGAGVSALIEPSLALRTWCSNRTVMHPFGPH